MGFLSDKIEKRTLDFPAAWKGRSIFGGGYPTSAGSTVNQETAMSLSAVWAGVNFYATVLGSLPLCLHERVKQGKIKAVNHPQYGILRSVTNPEMVAMIYRENIIASLLLLGKSYSEKVENGAGNLAELWPIPFWRVTPKRDDNENKYFQVTMPITNEPKDIPANRILEIIGAYGGASILNLLKESLGLSISLNEYAALFFGAGSHPGVIVSHPGTLGDVAHGNLQRSLVDKYSGLGKSHKLLLLDEAMKIEKIGHSPEDAQAIESRVFQINEVARILNLPPHILREMSKMTNNNIEHQGLEAVIYSLGPMATRLEQHFDAQLLSKKDRQRYFYKHNLEGLLRGDSKARSEFYWKMFQMGAYSINDILSLEDRNTIGPEGDKRFVMANMAPIDKIDNIYAARSREIIDGLFEQRTKTPLLPLETRATDSDIEKRDKLKKKMSPLFKKDFQRIVNKETKAIKKYFNKGSVDGFEKWLKDFYKTMPEYIVENVGSTFSVFAESMKDIILTEIGEESADIEDRITEFTAGFAKRYAEDSEGQMVALLENDDPETLIVERADEWNEKKADKQTTRQTTSLTGMVGWATILGAGYKLKWATRGKSCPYCNALHGAVISSFEEAFVETGTEIGEGEKKMIVKRRTKYPQLHRSCDCNVVKE